MHTLRLAKASGRVCPDSEGVSIYYHVGYDELLRWLLYAYRKVQFHRLMAPNPNTGATLEPHWRSVTQGNVSKRRPYHPMYRIRMLF